MTRRKLTSDEIDLWHRVIEKAERLHPGSMTSQPLPKPKPNKHPLPNSVSGRAKAEPGQKVAPRALAKPAVPPAVKMDNKAFSRMKRGKLRPEGRIDLHGMTLSEAQPELTRFILSSQASGRRLVLVITGKGPSGMGVLKQSVPVWLDQPTFRRVVNGYRIAHPRHGGEGALYVRIRRRQASRS